MKSTIEQAGIVDKAMLVFRKEPYQLSRWLWLEAGMAAFLWVSALWLPVRVSALTIILLAVGMGMFAIYRPFSGLVLLLSLQPIIYMYKRLQFIHVGLQAEFNNPISLLPQILIISLLVRIIWDILVQSRVRRPDPMALLVTLIIGAYGLGIFLNTSLLAGVFGFRATVFPILLFFIGQRLIKTNKQVKYILQILVVIAFIVCVYGLKQAVIGFYPFEHNWAIATAGFPNPGWFLLTNYKVYLRVFSIVSSPFEFAALAMVGPFFLLPLYYFQRKSRKKHLVFGVMIVVMIGALFASGIRGAWIGFIAGSLTWIIVYRTRNLNAMLAKGVFVVSSVIVFVPLIILVVLMVSRGYNSPLVRRLESLADPLNAGQMQTRFERWKEAIQIASENPFGQGTGSSGYNARRFGNEIVLIPDSLYFQALIELGWVGPLLFLLLFTFAIIVNIHTHNTLKSMFLRNLSLMIAVMTVAVAIHGLTTPLQESQMVIGWFWLFLGARANFRLMDTQDA